MLGILQPGGASHGEITPDGFRSAFDDGRGWWGLGRFAPEPRLSLVREHAEPATSRLTDGDALVLDRRLLADASASFAGEFLDWTTGLRYVHTDRDAVLIGVDGDARLKARGSRLDGCVRASPPASGFCFQASAPLWREHGDETGSESGWGLRYEAPTGWAVQLAHTHARNDAAFTAHLLDESVPLGINLATRSWHLAARTRPTARLRFEVTGHQDEYGRNRPLRDAAIYQCRPEGRGDGFGSMAVLDAGAGHELLYRYTDESLEAETTLSWSGARFGRIEMLRFDLRSHLLGWRRRGAAALQPRLECEMVRADVFGHASLQSWPFTETVIDLLGVKQVLAGTLVADWQRLTVVADWDHGALASSLGLSWYRIEPRGFVETWRRILVFGVDEFEHEDLAIERIDLASVLLGATWSLGRQEASFAIQQFFLGEVKQRHPDQGAPRPPGAGGARRDGWFGGTYAVFGLTLRP